MNKKLMGLFIFVICSLIVLAIFFLMSKNDDLKININSDDVVQAEMMIFQRYLNEEIILYENNHITTDLKEIERIANKGESELILAINGVEQNILGYVDTSQSILEINLEIVKNHDILDVYFTVKTSLANEKGKLNFPIED